MTTRKKPAPQVPATTQIQDCQFYGVKWDATAVQAIQTIAEGLVENAKGLGALAAVLKSQNVQIDCLIKVGGDV